MATRCAIGYMYEDNIVFAKYSHYDGYPSHTGKMLVEHYDFNLKIQTMIALGDQSYLAPEIFPKGDTHSFETPEKDVIVFYGRDRGEPNTAPKTFNGMVEFIDHYEDLVDYLYVYNPTDKMWKCWSTSTKAKIDLYEKEAA